MTLYTTGCPKCIVLKSKLDAKGIDYEISDDVNYLIDNGIMEAPVLRLDDDEMLPFVEAVKYINSI